MGAHTTGPFTPLHQGVPKASLTRNRVIKLLQTKKTKIVKYLVSQGFINHMKETGLFHYVDEIPEEELAKESQLFQEGYRANVLLTKKLQASQKVLLDQYDAFGYAYDVKEVTDNEAKGKEEVEN